ncbi:hypothetical protein KJ865_01925, partial [Myxococcota bacterium]|nr:hypothetical protein [Myxococcota bacterium]
MARDENEIRESFIQDPTAMDAFSALRRLYQNEERWAELAWVYETRAHVLDADNRRADMYFKAADLYLGEIADE